MDKQGDSVTFCEELRRMRSSDHLYQPQRHRSYQYSGFCRKGGNPDRFDCLYEEDGWRVVADHVGPGVVSRIWTPHPVELIPEGAAWGDIRIDVDHRILFEGPANDFFLRGELPFADPFTTVRMLDPDHETAEREAQGEKKWLTSYVPIPFKTRFRYMQRDVLYCNINIKAFPDDTGVESFWDINWDEAGPDIQQTARVWASMDLLNETRSRCRVARQTVSVPAREDPRPGALVIDEIAGPAIVHGIRLKTDATSAYGQTDLHVYWDSQEGPAIRAPLDHGFGSREQRTLALGQSLNGWRYLFLPMPFRKRARLELVSHTDSPAAFDVELFVEQNVSLPDDVMYLHSYANTGFFQHGVDKFEQPDLPLADFFYHNGYRAFDHKGKGHLAAYADLFHCQPEVDEHVYFDDERTFPDNIWNGTGHEDLFDQSWGHSPLTSPMASGGSQDFEEVNVKLFWNDPMTFRSAIRFNWEWAYKFGIQPPLDARFASVVYWYE